MEAAATEAAASPTAPEVGRKENAGKDMQKKMKERLLYVTPYFV